MRRSATPMRRRSGTRRSRDERVLRHPERPPAQLARPRRSASAGGPAAGPGRPARLPAGRPAVCEVPLAVPAGAGCDDRAVRHSVAGLLRGPHRLHRPDRTHGDDPAGRVQLGGARPGDRGRCPIGPAGDAGRGHGHGLRARAPLPPGAAADRRPRDHRRAACGHRVQHQPGQRRHADRQPGRAGQPPQRREHLPPARARLELRDHHGGPGDPGRRRAGPRTSAADPLDAERHTEQAAQAGGGRSRRDRARLEDAR